MDLRNIEKQASNFEFQVFKIGKKLDLLNQVIVAQEEAEKAHKVARKLYEEYIKSI